MLRKRIDLLLCHDRPPPDGLLPVWGVTRVEVIVVVFPAEGALVRPLGRQKVLPLEQFVPRLRPELDEQVGDPVLPRDPDLSLCCHHGTILPGSGFWFHQKCDKITPDSRAGKFHQIHKYFFEPSREAFGLQGGILHPTVESPPGGS